MSDDLSQILKKVQKLSIKLGIWRVIVCRGLSLCLKGQGMDFEEVREYAPGDDVRSIDWNVTAKMDKPYIKVYREDRELTLFLCVDVSASGLFGSGLAKRNAI